jgi:hypothetical protein
MMGDSRCVSLSLSLTQRHLQLHGDAGSWCCGAVSAQESWTRVEAQIEGSGNSTGFTAAPEDWATSETPARRTRTLAVSPLPSRPTPPGAGSATSECSHKCRTVLHSAQLDGCCCTASMPASAAGCRELTLSRNPRKVPCLPDPTLLLGCAVKVRSGTSYTISCPAPTWSDIKASRASHFMLHSCIGLSSVSVHDKWSCSVRPRRLHAHLWPLVPLAPIEGLGCEIKGAVELAAQLRITTVYMV